MKFSGNWSFDSKVVVITGAASGLGKAMAIQMADSGCVLALVDKNLAGLKDLEQGFLGAAKKISIHQADISNEDAIVATRQAILEQHGRVDVLINNAAVSISCCFENMDMNDFREIFESNFWGTVNCTKQFLPDLKKQKDSRLVNVISAFALIGFPGKSAYGSSKSAVMGFSYTLRTELAGSGVRVSVVIPPPLQTDLVKSGKHISEEKKASEIALMQKRAMPLDKAARKIVSGIQKGRFRIRIGRMIWWTDLAARFFPDMIHGLIGRKKDTIDFV